MSAKFSMLLPGGLLPLLVVLLAALPLAAANESTANDLLEKAIYTEETVGNLDEAIKLYEQVIAEGKAARSAAAKAQYRVGLIYEKQGKQAEAAAAFRAVVDNFADQADLVAEAQKRLPSELELLAEPWGEHGDEMQFNMKMPTGLEVGTMIYSIAPAKREGKEIWECVTRGLVTINGGVSLSRVACDKKSFAPIESYWRHKLIGVAEGTYKDGSVTIKVEGQEKANTIKVKSPVFDNEQGVELFRRLPLKEGYKTTVRIVATLGAGEIPLGMEVTAKETLDVPAGKFECYKLELNIGQTFWVSTDEHRYVVRFQAGGVTADLVRVDDRKSADALNKPMEVRGNGFSLTLPAGWRSYTPDKGFNDKSRSTYLMDPGMIAESELAVDTLDSLKEEERKSPQAWTESALKGMAKALKDFKIREPGIQQAKVGDREGAVVVADYTDDGERVVLYGFAAFGDKSALNMRFHVAADKFEELKPQFDELAASLKVE